MPPSNEQTLPNHTHTSQWITLQECYRFTTETVPGTSTEMGGKPVFLITRCLRMLTRGTHRQQKTRLWCCCVQVIPDTMLLCLICTLGTFSAAIGGHLSADEEKWAEKLINKEDAVKMQKALRGLEGDGYGTDYILIPDGDGIPQKAVLTTKRQQKFWGFGGGEGRADGEAPPTERPISEDVHFMLYTRKNPIEGQPITVEDPESIRSSNYDPSKPTKMIVHGWKSSGDSETVLNIKRAYMTRSDLNVIGVDWSPIASNYYYPTPASETVRVGRHVGRMVEVLHEDHGARHEDFHIIGHSLGAHVAGAAGSTTRTKISRVTGLDPALPGFQYYQHTDGRLDENDAEFVEAIHTCSGALGMSSPVGHADFYPNGGSPFQPGCCCMPEFTEACSHGRSHQYFAESIITDTPFQSSRCATWDEFKRAECAEDMTTMGEFTPSNARGIYYLVTNSTPPYALGDIGARYAPPPK